MKRRTMDPWMKERLREAIPVICVLLVALGTAIVAELVMPAAGVM